MSTPVSSRVGLSRRTVTAIRLPTEVRTGRTERLEVSRELPQVTTARAPRGRAKAATASMYSSATPVRRPAAYSATAAAAKPADRGVNAFSKLALPPPSYGDRHVLVDHVAPPYLWPRPRMGIGTYPTVSASTSAAVR